MIRKQPMILAGFVILGLLDGLMAYAWQPDYTLSRFSVIPHFFLMGMLVFVYNKDNVTRILSGLLAGLVSALFFQGAFWFDPLYFTAAAWLAGLAPGWSNSLRFSWLFFPLFAFGYDLLPWIWMRLFTPYNGSLLLWLWRMETFSVLLSILSLWVIRYAADVMDRYFKIIRIRQARADRKKLMHMHLSGR
ncbi:hypothetical protein [uncultured Faecalibaculum sp.]|uniref:hypothetical protein n=2 Tax=uncultured Faecalibaculum sp. TaxID=1729681 RepID=UPI0025F11F67|nr:hypothetical protein [uncultured Faecalibaculum sp.]